MFLFGSTQSQDTLLPVWHLEKQLKNHRVLDAALSSDSLLKALFEEKNRQYPPKYLYWRAFKLERTLELWSANHPDSPYVLIKNYPIYTTCGDLGPKRERGDMQIPEGFYKVEYFNPNSAFWLSFKINYPNGSDSLLGNKKKLGGDIFIHGDTLTIGCLPLTDSLIKEVYWITLLAHNVAMHEDSASVIPFHIYPAQLTHTNWIYLQNQYWGNPHKIHLWNSMQGAWQFFEEEHKIPAISIDDQGFYKIIFPKQKPTNQQAYGLPHSGPGQSGG